MKKSLKLLVGLALLLIPINVQAFSGSASISCGKTELYPGDTTTCTISGSSDGEVNGISGNISVSGSIGADGFSKNGDWEGNTNDGLVALYTDNNKSGGLGIATVTIKANSVGAGTVSFTNIIYSDANFNSNSISSTSATITVKEKPTPPTAQPTQPSQPNTNNNTTNNNKKEETKKNNDATLKLLSISEGKINFEKNKTEYSVEVSNDVEKITLKAEANNSKSKVTLPKDLSLKVGKNTFEIKVEAEDKTTKIYKLNVTRLERKLSTNSKLKSIEIKGSSLTLEDNKYVYDVKDIKTNSIEINAIAEDENATVKVYGDKSIGKQDVIVIEVTAEDGTTSNYILHVNNVEDPKQNNKYNIILYVIIIVLALLSVGVSTGVIIKLKKKRNNI